MRDRAGSHVDGIVKVGGSLLSWPGLPISLVRYLEGRPGERLVLVIGGGPAADWIRDLDQTHALGDERAHRLALRAMDLTAHVLASLVAGMAVAEDLAGLDPAWHAGRTPVLAPRRFLDADDLRPDPLPHSWSVTSDSIAARIALRLGTENLVLLKSAPLPPGTGREAAARLGLVDPEFPRAAHAIARVDYLNLRDPGAAVVPLGQGSGRAPDPPAPE